MPPYKSPEADELKRRMQHVRCRMDTDVSGIIERSQQLLDWRYYYRKYPWACLGAALAAGYLTIPKQRRVKIRLDDATRREFAELARCNGGNQENVAPKSLAASILGVVATMAVRAAAPVIARRVSRMFGDRSGGGSRAWGQE